MQSIVIPGGCQCFKRNIIVYDSNLEA